MMRVGLQAAAVANGAASLANMFCPMVPRTLVPKSLLGKANSFVDGLDKPSNVADSASVQASVESGDGGGKAKRGGDLRDFEIFLDKHDTKQVYAGLRRVCNEENGEAIWVSEASAQDIESGRGDVLKELEMENEQHAQLRAELESKIKQLQEQLGVGAKTTPMKLREEVRDARE